MISVSVCPICSGKSFRDFIACKDFTTTGEIFTLKQCNFCDFVLTDPRPDEESIGHYYQSESYISHTGGKKNVIDSIYLAARKIALGKKRRTIEDFSHDKTILDFGCGTGEFLAEMKNCFWQITGVEPSQVANTKAASLTKTKIYSSISELPPTSRFDVITLWHVLEHLHDLERIIKALHSLLRDSGTIFIAVPNLESYDAKHYKANWAAYDVPRHLWHFNKNNMKSLLEKSGFKLIDIRPMKMDSFYVSLLSETYQRPEQIKVLSFAKAVWYGLVSNIKAKKTMNYSSLIYIAKR